MALELLPNPSGSELLYRETARAFVEQQLRPFAVQDDEKSHFRREAFAAAAKLGLHCLLIPKEWGGKGESSQVHFSVLETIARQSVAWSIVLGVTNLVQGAILQFGTTEQKEKFLRPLTKGDWLGAFSLSEPQSGSDAGALKLKCTRASGGYRLTGTKVWCTSAGVADLYLVMGRTGEDKAKGITAFLVPKETAGFRVGKQEKKLGLRASTLAELVFEDCFIPDSQRLSDEGEGFKVALSQLDSGRIAIGVAGLGVALEALERVWKYRRAQEAAGIEFPEGTRQAMASHLASLQAVGSLATATCAMRDAKERITGMAAQVKLLGSDLAMTVTSDAVQFMGERGYSREMEVERMMRDAKALQIVEGTNQIQRLVLARELDAMVE